MANGSVGRDRKKELRWRRIVRGQPGSGFSIRAYCAKHGVRESAYYWWRTELARRDVAKPAATFVPVTVAVDEPARVGGGPIEIVLPDGRLVRMSGRVDKQALADVLAVLGAQGGGPC
jgi:hypothetical protein